MLTEQQIQEMNEQLTVLKSENEKKESELEELNTFMTNNIKSYFKKRFQTITSNFDVSLYVGFDTEWGENDEIIRHPKLDIDIVSIESEGNFWQNRIEMRMKENEVTYDASFNKFKSSELLPQIKMKMIQTLIKHEQEYIAYCMEMVPTYTKLVNERAELCKKIREIDRQLEQHEAEELHLNALANLKEGAVYSDGAGEGWYLKVTKITNKLVKCDTAKHFDAWNDRPEGIFHLSNRQINKDDFINGLASGYYKLVDEEVIYEW